MIRILLIEDDYQLLRLCTRLLQNAEFEVIPAATQHAALDMFRRYKSFSLCISDINVGSYNPMMLIRELYGLRQLSRTPMLMMSAHMDQYQMVCEESNLPYLAKPFSNQEFVNRAQALVVPIMENSELLF